MDISSARQNKGKICKNTNQKDMRKASQGAYIQDADFNLTECFFPQNGHSVLPNP
jgi:hypothetical protein